MDTLIMVSIMTLVLFSMSGSVRADTLVVANQMKTRGNVPVFVTCHITPKLAKSVPLGQVVLTEIPARDNVTDAAGFRTCVGTFYNISDAGPYERPYVLYSSFKNYTESKKLYFFLVKDDGFYRWNDDKKDWDKIRPITWF